MSSLKSYSPSLLETILASLVLFCSEVSAATYNVHNVSDVQNLPTLSPGDIVIFHDGTYANVNKTLTGNGTAEEPIFVYAANLGGASFSGSTRISLSGSHIILAGFKFDGVTANGGQADRWGIVQTASGSSDCVITNCMFRDFNANSITANTYWLVIQGYRHHVEYCSFEGKTDIGSTIVFANPESAGTMDTPRSHIMQFNYFGPRTVIESNGSEGIRVGDSAKQNYNMASVFQFNYFYRTIYGASAGEPEIISNKSKNNIYRYNTFVENKGQLTLRHGDNSTVEGNFFFGGGLADSSGVRIIGQNHLVRNNYFQDIKGTGVRGTIVVVKGDASWPSTDDGSGTEAAHNTRVFHNTFVNCNQPFNLGQGNGTVIPTGVQLRNNVVQSGSGDGAVFTLGYSASSISFNGDHVFHPSGNYGVTGLTGVTYGPSPQLGYSSSLGYSIPSASSPVLDNAPNTVPGTGLDIRGLARPSTTKDKGSYEREASGIGLGPLQRGDVGPSYYDGPPGTFDGPQGSAEKFAVGASTVTASADDGNVPANTVDGNLATRWSANGDGQWIRYDLGITRTVHFIKIAWVSGDTRTAYFDVQVSPNGTDWTNLLLSHASSGASAALETYSFSATSARYVRIVGHGNSVNLWNSIAETEIWGTTSAPQKLSVPGSAVSASADDGNVPANTVDGSLDTRWSANGAGQWIRYDLGSVKSARHLKIAWLNGDTRTSMFDIQISTDGSTWTTVLTDAQSSGSTTALETVDISDTNGRYVRYLGYGNNVNLWNSITEFEIWGN